MSTSRHTPQRGGGSKKLTLAKAAAAATAAIATAAFAASGISSASATLVEAEHAAQHARALPFGEQLVARQRSGAAAAPASTSASGAAAAAASPSASGSARVPNGILTDGRQLNGQTFDYVIVGGGLAGLAVASRLSEDSDVTVAVVEAGGSGVGDATLTTPAANLYDSSVGTAKDWQYVTTAQQGLNGRTAPWPRGKVLGGSSAINGLYWVRASKIEHNVWAELAAGGSANNETVNQIWGWDNMLAAMKKSETFTAPRSQVSGQLGEALDFDAGSHGTSGPIHATWPAVTYDSIGAFVQSAAQVGVPFNPDPDGGNTTGAFVALSTINPSNWTRSFSRTGYIDPVLNRPNLVSTFTRVSCATR